MKKLIFAFLFLCFFLNTALSQTAKPISKGNYLLGGGFSSNYYDGKNYQYYSIGVSPNVGYFFVDNFAFGVTPSAYYSNNNMSGKYTNDYWMLGLGVFGKYYSNNGFIADLRFSAGYYNSEATYFSISPRIGYCIFINNKVSLEGLIGPTFSFGDAEYTEIPFTVGFQVFL